MITFLLAGMAAVYSIAFAFVRANSIYSVLCVFFVFLIFSTNRQNPDWLSYIVIFEHPELYAEFGYVWLVNGLKIIGFGHEGVVFFLALVVSATLLRYSKYSPYLSIAILLYTVYPMAIDVTQIRNTFGFFLVLNMLIEIERKRHLLALLFLAAAASFHYFFLSYLLWFLLIACRGVRYWSVAIALSTSMAILILPYVLPLVASTGALRNLSAYLSPEIKYHSLFIWGCVLVFDILVFGFVQRFCMLNEGANERLRKVLYSAMISGIPFLVGLLYVDDFHRFFRSLFILKYLLAAVMWPALSSEGRAVLLIYLLFSVLVFGEYFNHQLNFDSILFGQFISGLSA